MSDHELQMLPVIERAIRRAFVQALIWVIVGWSTVTAILWYRLDRHDIGVFADTLGIAAASGVIACVAVVPGMLIQFVVSKGDARCLFPEPWGRLTAALAAGMMIRSIGTVALFLTYRYHLASSTELIAGMTLGWYVFLTSIEVLALARTLPKSVQPTAGEAPIHVDASNPL